MPDNIPPLTPESWARVFGNSERLRDSYQAIVDAARNATDRQGNAAPVDPALLAAVIAQETGRGRGYNPTTGAAEMLLTHNNPAGLLRREGQRYVPRDYATLEDGLRAAANTASRLWREGGETIEGMRRLYAPNDPASDPRNLNRHWVPGVRNFLDELDPFNLNRPGTIPYVDTEGNTPMGYPGIGVRNVVPGILERRSETEGWEQQIRDINTQALQSGFDPFEVRPPAVAGTSPTLERDPGAPQNTTIGELFPDWAGGAQQRVMGTPGWMRPPGTVPQPGDPDYVEPSDPHAGLVFVPGKGWVGLGFAQAVLALGPGITHFPGSGPYGGGTVTLNDPITPPPPPPPPPPIGEVPIAPGGTPIDTGGGGGVFSPSSGGLPIGPLDGPAGGGQGGPSGTPIAPGSDLISHLSSTGTSMGGMAAQPLKPDEQPFFGDSQMQQLPAWAQLFPEFGQRDRIAQLLAEQGFGGPQPRQMPPIGMPDDTIPPDVPQGGLPPQGGTFPLDENWLRAYRGGGMGDLASGAAPPIEMPPVPDNLQGFQQLPSGQFMPDGAVMNGGGGGMGELAAGAAQPPLPTHSMQQQPGSTGPLPGAPPGGPEAAIPWWLMGLNGPGGAPVGA